MKQPERFSDELLNAYLDGELDIDEQQRLIEELNADAQLSQRVSELARIRRMVQFAYHDIATQHETQQQAPGPRKRMLVAMAASLTLALGVAMGWLAHQYNHQQQSLLELANHVELNNQRTQAETWRVLLHLTTDNPRRLQVVLDETEALLNHYANNEQPLQVEILANGKGLNLLRTDTSSHRQRIQSMQAHYKNLVFVACGTAIKRLQEEHKLNVNLLNNVDVTPSAIGEVLKKQGEGWTYIKI